MLTPEKIVELKEEHGPRLWCETTEDGDEVVIRPPKRVVFMRFLDEVGDDGKSHGSAMTKFVNACVVYPGETERKELFERWPGLVAPLANRLREMSGAKTASEGKAL